MPTKKKEVAVVEKNELVVSNEDFDLFAQDGQQDDNISQEDCAIPRLTLLQSNSPQCNPAHDKYIKGVVAGDLLDSVTGKTFDGSEGVVVIPCSFRKTYLEWHDRNSKDGKGFIADHGNNPSVLNNTTKNDKGKDVTPEGTIIEPTCEYYVLVVTDEGASPYVLSLKSTGLKVSKTWNSNIKLQKRKHPGTGQVFSPAMFYCTYKVTSIGESKDDYSWMNWKIDVAEDTVSLEGGLDLYKEAKLLSEAVSTGEKKADNSDNENF